MCEKCRELVSVDKDHKVTTILNRDKYIDYYGMQWKSVTIMQLNHDEKGNPYAFIATGFRNRDDVTHGGSIDITHCPFCGQRLIERV